MSDTPNPQAAAENDAPVDYEVWRSGPNPRARDVRLYFGLDGKTAQETLDLCYADKAEAYPDAAVEFYVMRLTRTRVAPRAAGGADEDTPHPQAPADYDAIRQVLLKHLDDQRNRGQDYEFGIDAADLPELIRDLASVPLLEAPMGDTPNPQAPAKNDAPVERVESIFRRYGVAERDIGTCCDDLSPHLRPPGSPRGRRYTDTRPPQYEHTHTSVDDGSPAMLVSQDAETITLVNEDGVQWTDPLTDWRPIPPAVGGTDG